MSVVEYIVQNEIAEIRFSNPPVNAITSAVLEGLLSHLASAKADKSVKAVLLTSAVPKRFCAGLDLAAMKQDGFEAGLARVEQLYSGLFDAQCSLGKPSIAVVDGAARGGGMTVAVSCDMLVASEHATFGYPEIDVGYTPAIHYTHLPRIVGRHRAFELLFSGRSFSAQEALSLGLVNCVTEGDPLAKAREMAAAFAKKSPLIMKLGRQAFYKAIDIEYRRGVASAVEHFGNVAATADADEGLAAFVEKRAPQWPSQT